VLLRLSEPLDVAAQETNSLKQATHLLSACERNPHAAHESRHALASNKLALMHFSRSALFAEVVAGRTQVAFTYD
jgi:hypothetical protein